MIRFCLAIFRLTVEMHRPGGGIGGVKRVAEGRREGEGVPPPRSWRRRIGCSGTPSKAVDLPSIPQNDSRRLSASPLSISEEVDCERTATSVERIMNTSPTAHLATRCSIREAVSRRPFCSRTRNERTSHALCSCIARTGDTTTRGGPAVVLQQLVRGDVRHAAVAAHRVHLPADHVAVVLGGSPLVRRRMDPLAGRRPRGGADHRHFPRPRAPSLQPPAWQFLRVRRPR